MKSIRLFAVVAVLLALPLFADPPGKYKDWANTPQGWFMTRAERAQWSAIKTDDEAEQFVTKFLASRGPDFPSMVADRIAAADKYLTYKKTPGSQTLRGKIIVVLGPPSSFNVSEHEGRRRSGESTVAGSVGAAGGAASLGDMNQAAERSLMTEARTRNYDIGYTADKLAFGKPLTLTVELDTVKNTERITSKKAENDLQDAMEMAASASIKAK